MILLIYRLLCGYLYVRVRAENPEKILNLCAANGIGIWRVSVKKNVIYFKIGITSFKRLRKFKRKIPCRIHITKKLGLPFFVSKNKSRYGFVCGFAIFVSILYFMSGSVWNICINGNKHIKSSDIMTSLNEIGIYEGARIKNIDSKDMRNELLLKQRGLSWAAINIEGTKVTVDVTETKELTEKEDLPSNLLSLEDGIIKKIEIKNGVTEVKVGDTIQKGQLLVSGMIEYDNGSVDFVKSDGAVFAQVDYCFSTVQPFKVREYVKTGESETKKVLDFFGYKIPLFLGDVEKPYISHKQNEKISSGNSYLPIKIHSKKFYKTKEVTYELDPKRAEKRAKKVAEQEIKKFVKNGEIVSCKQKTSVDNEKLTLTTEIKCIKDVVFEEKLLLDTSN